MKIYTKFPTEILDPNIVDYYEPNPYKSPKFKIEGTVGSGNPSYLGIPAHYPFKANIFKLIEWKLDGVSQHADVFILRSVEFGTSEIDEIAEGSIIAAEAFMNSDNTRAVMISGRIIGTNSLPPKEGNSNSEERIELTAEIIFTKSELGEFNAQTSWDNTDLELKIDVSNLDQITDEKETCLALLKDQKLWSEKIENFFVTKMLKEVNESWLGEGEAPWNEIKFKEKLVLETLEVSAKGNFTFWYGTGDMLGGHWIVVSGSLEKGPLDIDTPG